MKFKILICLLLFLCFISCHQKFEHKTVLCIPVYGQSLALGEEATLITDFDSLAFYANGRIVTERMDYEYGYFDNNKLKEFAKRITHYHKRSFELSLYSMAELLADSLKEDTVICIFPGGQGTTTIEGLGKGSLPYQNFINNIMNASESAKKRGWDFWVPAICWMQGESDIEEYSKTNYKRLLKQFQTDINNDIQSITHQTKDVKIICYQTNNISGGRHFQHQCYNNIESRVPQNQLELVLNDSSFYSSSPTYPFDFARERIHIDGISQKKHGKYVGLAALDILRVKKTKRGVFPIHVTTNRNEISIEFHVTVPPLTIDTTYIIPIAHYGFSVITPDNRDIINSVKIKKNNILISCSENPDKCRLKYAINGERMKSGRHQGPRGNLRDSQGDTETIIIKGKTYPLHNWCWQFDYYIHRDSSSYINH